MIRSLAAFAISLAFVLPAAAQDNVTIPFNGKDLTGWKAKGDAKRSKWAVGAAVLDENNPTNLTFTPIAADGKDGELVNVSGAGGADLYSEAKFGDIILEIEFMIPKGSNSGIYFMGEYEVQVLDSYGKEKVGPGDLGGLYAAAAPSTNAAKKPGEWQKFVIDFQAPKYDAAGNKTSNAKFVKVTLNDRVIHENVEMKGPTPGGLTGREVATGPILFQGDHGAVSFRNLKVTAK